MTKDEQIVVVSFDNGVICAYDAKNGFSLMGVIEKESVRFSRLTESAFRLLEVNSHN